MKGKKAVRRLISSLLVLVLAMSLAPGAFAKSNKQTGLDNYFYFMSSADDNAVVAATKVLHKKDASITAFDDVVIPLDNTHGVAGWYFDQACTERVTELSYDASRTEPVPLYPDIREGFWVTFDSTGGSYIAPQFFVESASAPTSEPTRSGYTFAGWYADAACDSEADFDKIKAPATVYAKWNAADAEYTVIHWKENADDTGYSYEESEVKSGTSGETTEASAKEYEGFTAQAITQQTIAGDNSTIVNVYYDRIEYTLRFYAEIFVNANPCTGEELENLRITAKYGADISESWPAGVWNLYRVEEFYEHVELQGKLFTMPLGGKDFYQINLGGGHQAEYYLETLDGDYVLDHKAGDASSKDVISDSDFYDIPGFHFAKLDAKPNDGTGSWTPEQYAWFYAEAKFYYARNSYDVVYMNNSEDPVKKTAYKYQADITDAADFIPERPDGVPEYYEFAGWCADQDCLVPYQFNGAIMPAHSITVYAKWAPPVCKVTFMAYGKEVEVVSDVPYQTSLSETPSPSGWLKEGDTFFGWTYNEAGTEPFNADTLITKDIVLYAQVNDGSNYGVTYDANGGNGTVSDSYRYMQSRTAMVRSGDALTAPKGSGTRFYGWNTAADGSGTMYEPGEGICVSEDITLYAIWRKGDSSKSDAVPSQPMLNTNDHYAYIVGYPDGTVQPDGNITRAEASTIFFRLLTDESREQYWATTNPYSDVNAGDWYNNAISTLSNAGIVSGYPDGTFRPNAPITRAEMAKIITTFAKLRNSEDRFNDISGHWAEASIKLAAGNGWLEGYPDGSFRPQQNITRAETMTMINRVLSRVPANKSRLLSPSAMLTFPDCQADQWYYIAVQEATNSHTYNRAAIEKNGDEQWTKLRDNRDWSELEY